MPFLVNVNLLHNVLYHVYLRTIVFCSMHDIAMFGVLETLRARQVLVPPSNLILDLSVPPPFPPTHAKELNCHIAMVLSVFETILV